MTTITFDPRKRAATLRERGVDFIDAADVFEGETATDEDRRKDYGEVRWITAGFLRGRMMIVVWTPRGTKRHVISMRKANERERKAYRERFGQS